MFLGSTTGKLAQSTVVLDALHWSTEVQKVLEGMGAKLAQMHWLTAEPTLSVMGAGLWDNAHLAGFTL